jgi:hypothetical protein
MNGSEMRATPMIGEHAVAADRAAELERPSLASPLFVTVLQDA